MSELPRLILILAHSSTSIFLMGPLMAALKIKIDSSTCRRCHPDQRVQTLLVQAKRDFSRLKGGLQTYAQVDNAVKADDR